MNSLRDRPCQPWIGIVALLGLTLVSGPARAAESEPVVVEGQPLAANVKRVLDALEYLGTPLPEETNAAIRGAAKDRDARKLQLLLDPQERNDQNRACLEMRAGGKKHDIQKWSIYTNLRTVLDHIESAMCLRQ